MKIKINKSLEYWLLILFVPIEAVNGFLLAYSKMTYSPVGYVYRLLLILYFGKACLRKPYSKYLLYFVLLISGVFFNVIMQPYSSIAFDLGMILRILYSAVMCLGIYEMLRTKKVKIEILIKVLNDSSIVMIIVYFLSIVTGFGRSTYGDSGYKACFNASNSLTIVLVILAGFQLTLFFINKKKSKLIYFMILSIFIFLTGSKSGIVFLILFTAYMLRPKVNKVFLRKLVIVAGITVTLYYLLSHKFDLQMQAIIYRMTYFLKNSNSTIEYALSGRNNLLMAGWDAYKDNFTIVSLFIGNGSYSMHILIGKLSGWGILKSIEMDFFDIFFCFGMMGILSTYFLAIKTAGLRDLRKYNISPVYFLFWMCIVFSILGGHVFMDSFASTLLGLLTAVAAYEKINQIYIIGD